jgi:PAB1-binding protein PBP1
MSKSKLFLPLSVAVAIAAFAIVPAGAKSTGASHSSSAHSSTSHKSSAGHAEPAVTNARKPLPSGTRFAQKTCKTASCKSKHPGGTYMVPIKPKKGGAPA